MASPEYQSLISAAVTDAVEIFARHERREILPDVRALEARPKSFLLFWTVIDARRVVVVNWDYVISTTPKFIRATVIVVLLGLIVLGMTVIAGAVWSGQGLQAWGLKIEEYRRPEVQKCAALAAVVPQINTINQDALNLINSQITQLVTLVDKNIMEASAINNRGGYSSVADRLREEAEKYRKEAEKLRSKQDEIIASRASVAKAVEAACVSTPHGSPS